MSNPTICDFYETMEHVIDYIKQVGDYDILLNAIETGEFLKEISLYSSLEVASDAELSRISLIADILNHTQERSIFIMEMQKMYSKYFEKFNELSVFINRLADENVFAPEQLVHTHKTCANKTCGIQFVPTHQLQQYCSPKCRKQAANRRSNGTD